MPRVDYSPVPEVRAKDIRDPSERVHIDFPSVQFTGAVGQALADVGREGFGALANATRFAGSQIDSLGKQFDNVGNELWTRAVGLQQLQNETAAKKAALEYDTYSADQRIQYEQKLGDAANEDTFKAHVADLEAKRQEMRNKLGNPSAQAMFDNSTMQTVGRETVHAATHTAAQIKGSAIGASEARIKQFSDQFAKTDDIQEGEGIYKRIQEEFWSTRVPLMGWKPEQAMEEWQKITADMYAAKITNMSHGDPSRAMQMLEENKTDLPMEIYTKVKETVTTNLRERDSRNAADRIQHNMKDETLEKKIEEGDKMAKELNPEDDKLKDAIRARIITQHNIARKEEKEEHEKNMNTALDGIYGYNTPSGAKPTTHEEYYAIPGTRAAYDALGPKEKHQIDEALTKNSKEDYPRTPETRRRMNELLGEAGSERPEDREKFMSRDFYDEKIPGGDRDKLFALQRKMRGKLTEENPTVQRGMRVIQDLLPDQIRTWQKPEIRKQFMGALRSALESEMEKNKGVPLNDKQIRDIGGQLLQSEPELSGWRSYIPFGLGEKSVYEHVRPEGVSDIPEEDFNELKNTFPGATDTQILDMYGRIAWKREFDRFQRLKEQGRPKQAPAATTVPSGPRKTQIPQSQ